MQHRVFVLTKQTTHIFVLIQSNQKGFKSNKKHSTHLLKGIKNEKTTFPDKIKLKKESLRIDAE